MWVCVSAFPLDEWRENTTTNKLPNEFHRKRPRTKESHMKRQPDKDTFWINIWIRCAERNYMNAFDSLTMNSVGGKLCAASCEMWKVEGMCGSFVWCIHIGRGTQVNGEWSSVDPKALPFHLKSHQLHIVSPAAFPLVFPFFFLFSFFNEHNSSAAPFTCPLCGCCEHYVRTWNREGKDGDEKCDKKRATHQLEVNENENK